MFRSYKKECNELREYLLSEHIGMRPRYASAFLNVYGRGMAKRYRKAAKVSDTIMASPQASLPQTIVALDVIDLNIAFVATAYSAYMADLRRGKRVGTDVEKAIWAILDNRSDLLRNLDKGLAEYINAHAEEKFPTLYGDVLRLDDGQ